MRMFIVKHGSRAHAPCAWNSGAENIIGNMYIFGTHEQLREEEKNCIE